MKTSSFISDLVSLSILSSLTLKHTYLDMTKYKQFFFILNLFLIRIAINYALAATILENLA
ncbi:hypothetical protein ALP00_200080 [Pseudomonas coronafaciens pv. porri]|nr:hypothetical protein ALP00_200080 [Pseudomonas coronafaciens pv. porri]